MRRAAPAMTDLALAVQEGVYGALTAGVTLGQVFQHVPENTPPPVVIIGEDDVDPTIGGKGERFERHELTILTVVQGPGKRPLRLLQEQVRAALDNRPITAAGANLSDPVFLSVTDQLLADGLTYYGEQRFLIFAEPA
jgi:hypothetical protein